MRQLSEEEEDYRKRLEGYRREGYVVTPLEKTIEEGDPEEISERFEEFEKDVKSLKVLSEALMDLDTKAFEEDRKAIEGKLNDVARIPEIEDDILKLQLKLERRKKAERRREEEERIERGGFVRQMEKWRAEGYSVSRLEDELDSDMGNLEMVFKSFERDVNEIKKLRKVLEELWGKGFDDDLEELSKRIMDPDRLFENEEDLLRIKLRIDRQEKKKAVLQEAEEKMKTRFRETLEDWREAGFMVDHLEEKMDEDLDTVSEAFEKAKNDIGRIKILREELQELDTEGCEEDVEEIKEMLRDPNEVRTGEEAILDLQLKIERRRKEERRKSEAVQRMRDELRERIVNWRAEGFVTDYLYSLVEGDVEILREAVEDFDAAAKKMKELEEELRQMNTEGYEEEVDAILAKVRDVRRTDEVEDDVLNLLVRSKRERREKERIEQISETVEDWEKEGFDVQRVEDCLMGSDLKILEREFVTHKIGIHMLRELEKDLEDLDATGREEEMEEIRGLMHDIDNISKVEEMIFDLQRRIEESQEKARTRKLKESEEKHQYVEKLSEWVSEGFREGIIERLEQVIARDKDMETVRSAFKTFESEVARVKELREVLDNLEEEGFEAEINDLRESLKNIDELDRVEADMMTLIEKIERKREEEERRKLENEQKRREFGQQLEIWADEGFDVEPLRSSIEENDLATLRRDFVIYRIRIQKMRELQKELDEIAEMGFREDRKRIYPLLRDVKNIDEVEEEMMELRSKLDEAREEEGKRKEFRAKMEEWRNKGYNVERLENALMEEDIDLVSKEFLVFKIRMQKLEDLREEINVLALSAKDFLPEIEEIRKMLKDVDRITEIRERLSALKSQVEEKKKEEERREEEEREAREALEKKLTEWAVQGFKVEELEKILDGPLEVSQAAFEEFERGIEKATRLREELAELDTKGYEGEAELIASELYDVKDLVKAEEDLELLKDKLRRTGKAGQNRKEEEERLRGELVRNISQWRSQGYDVTGLEELLDSDLKDLRKAFVVFRIRVERLKELEEELETMDTEGFEEETDAIRKSIKRVDKVSEVADSITQLHLAIKERKSLERRWREEERKEREVYADKLVHWISEGYNVAPLEGVINEKVDLIRERFADFEQKVEKVKEVEGELEKLELGGHAREAKELRSMIADVDNVDEIISRLNEISGDVLVEPIRTEKEGEVDRKMEEGKPSGKDMESSHASLLSDLQKRLGALKFDSEKKGADGDPDDGGSEEGSEEVASRKTKKVKKVKKRKIKRK